MTPIHQKLGDFLQTKREAQGIKRSSMASYCNTNYGTIYSWETNQTKPARGFHKAIKVAYKISDDDAETYGLVANEPTCTITKTLTRAMVLKRAKDYQNHVNGFLLNDSPFEQGLKNKVATVVKQIEVLLEPLAIIDEALQAYQESK
jgi:transcriptional regulator with XRE-family HTH domain